MEKYFNTTYFLRFFLSAVGCPVVLVQIFALVIHVRTNQAFATRDLVSNPRAWQG